MRFQTGWHRNACFEDFWASKQPYHDQNPSQQSADICLQRHLHGGISDPGMSLPKLHQICGSGHPWWFSILGHNLKIPKDLLRFSKNLSTIRFHRAKFRQRAKTAAKASTSTLPELPDFGNDDLSPFGMRILISLARSCSSFPTRESQNVYLGNENISKNVCVWLRIHAYTWVYMYLNLYCMLHIA